MEHIILSHTAKHLAKNNILINDQHGFRNKLSTVTQLINTTSHWAETLNRRGQTDVILLDFSKAFDKVSHKHLYYKLQHYGIQHNTLGWINAFLSNRTQVTCVNGTQSNQINVTSGVPQGSVLGPVLFLLYINDINHNINSNIKLFADDSVVYREICSYNDHLLLQKDLDTLTTWAKTWLMDFNIKKCVLLPITLKRNPSHFKYSILGQTLDTVNKHDYLGVTISSDLKWTNHISKITGKASRTLGLLKRTLSPCSQTVKSTAYKMLVRPQVEYASEVWNPSTLKNCKKIEQIQRNAARFVFHDYRRQTSVTPLVQKLQWDSLYIRRIVQQSTMLYKIHYNLVDIQTPPYIQPAVHISKRIDHPLKYCNTIPVLINTFKFSFFPRSIHVWNRLPPSAVLHVTPSILSFQAMALPEIRCMQPLFGAALV